MNEFNYDDVTEKTFLTTAPFSHIYKQEDEFLRNIELQKMRKAGEAVGVRNVKALYESYVNSVENQPYENDIYKKTKFNYKDFVFKTTWEADSRGVRKHSDKGLQVACRHPILPTARTENIDTGAEKITLAYKPGSRWREITVDKSIIASPRKIIELADVGVSVTSENAKELIAYLQEIQDLNYSDITTHKSTSRLGWVTETDFMPYAESIVFDGDKSFAKFFESVHTKGSEEEWLKAIRAIRLTDTSAKIVIAGSFLSVLIESLNLLPAFIHVWSHLSSTGKTLLLMAGASVWANPEPGVYIQSFDSTAVGSERIASTANSLPVFIDELQLARDSWGNIRFDVYKLAQGVGRTRGTKTGAIEITPTWNNIFVTSGETPIVRDNQGQGAFARVIEVQLERILFDFEQGNKLAETLRANYGWGGKGFIEVIKKLGLKEIKSLFNQKVKELQSYKSDIQEKQVMIAAGLLTADLIASEYIFNDFDFGSLGVSELIPYLTTKEATSVEVRALELVRDWIASNSSKFEDNCTPPQLGFIEDNHTFIVRSELNKVLNENGFSDRTVLTGWKNMGLIQTEERAGEKVSRNSIRKTMNGQQVYMVALKNENISSQISF